jgi:hypothetical protein
MPAGGGTCRHFQGRDKGTLKFQSLFNLSSLLTLAAKCAGSQEVNFSVMKNVVVPKAGCNLYYLNSSVHTEVEALLILIHFVLQTSHTFSALLHSSVGSRLNLSSHLMNLARDTMASF